MKAKFIIQVTGLVAILVLVLGTAGFYLSHPAKRGQDQRGFEPRHGNFQGRHR